MEGFSLAKMLLILTLVLGTLLVNGVGRTLKPKDDDAVVQPQTFGPGLGLPNVPGFGGGSFPSPGLGGSIPSPFFSGSFPSPGLGTGSSSFCSFPGARCAPVAPGGSVGGGGVIGNGSP